ncbi:MAG: diguanylate cyclase domain [Actinomycetia bacterium]|nr:diguanylate cyclase domain [Actinomycetes bacterium]
MLAELQAPCDTFVTQGVLSMTDDDEVDPLAILRDLPDAVIVVDRNARLLWGNRTAERTLGWTIDELRGEPVDFLCHPDDLPTALASLASVGNKEMGTAVEIRVRDRSGRYRSVEVRGRDASDEPDIGGVIMAMRDTTDRNRWEVAGGNEDLYRAVLDHAPAITMIIDENGRVRGASRALTALVGRDLETSLGHHLREFVTHSDALTVEAELALAMSEPGQRSFEVAFTTRDGASTVPMSLTVVNLLDDRTVEGLVVSAVDITALAESRARIHHLANHDQLTGLPNRATFTERLHDALSAARRRDSSVSLLHCDLDGFKDVNDRYGHLAGDHVLKETAERLLTATRAGDTVARMGGDEFVILVEDGEARAIRALLARIREAVAAPMELPGGQTITITLTVGAATADGSSDVDDLLGRADAAMYAAKAQP